MGCSCLPWKLKRRKAIKHEEEFFFLQIGAALLEKQVSYYKGRGEAIRIFKAEELRKATNDYEESRVIGKTDITVVYKGTLDEHVVAIKNRALPSGVWIDYSISEIVILSQINHRNVVKLLGCCLETRIPSLIYEFVSNGSLYDHIYTRNMLSWDDRLRICVEIAEALVYLQSAFEVPIIHGDVKLTSILLDEYLVAKVGQFGFSRPVSMEKTERDQTERDAGVMWLTENLDPECYETGRLTEKSDVYSFGIVLVEILTGSQSLSMLVSSMGGNGLSKVMDASILREVKMMQFLPVAELAKNCLQSRGDNRPTIKEVALELRRIKTL